MQGLATNVCLALSQYIIPIGIDAGSWKFYFFFEGWLIIQLITVYFFFIETRGATLEEINRTFDGADAVEEISSARKGGDDVAFEVTHVDEIREKVA